MFSHPRLATPATRWRPPSSVLRVRSVLYLLSYDCFAIIVSFVAVAAMQRGVSFHDRWLTTASLLLPIYVLIAFNLQAYAPAMLQNPFEAIRRGAKALMASLCALLVIAFYLKSSAQFSRLEFAIASASALVFLATGRYIFVRHLAAFVGGNPFSSILITDGNQPVPPGEFSVVIAAESYFNPDEHDPMMYDRLARSLSAADRVMVTCPPERRIAWAQALRGVNIQCEILIPELASLSPVGFAAERGTPSLIISTAPLDLVSRMIKRAFDICVASVALLILSPLLLLIAALIKLESPGPVLFKQMRIGRSNRQFKLSKFRSMRSDATDANANKLVTRDDTRVTRVGRLIRKTSVDELPQLFHVLTGEMSIVGPRPHALGARAASKLYWEVDGRYWHRHAAKPGLTGLAQVRGFRGNTEVEEDLTNRLESDLEYLQAWSIWRDLKIIFLTVRVLLHSNAF